MNRYPKFIATGAFVLLSAGPALAYQAKTPPAQGTQTQGQATNQHPTTYGGLNAAPWYGDKGIQQHLGFNANQSNLLNKAYGDAYSSYNAKVGQLGSGLTEQQRALKMQEYEATFNQNMGKSVDGAITNPQQRDRYNQLQLQYQGYGAFDNSAVQQKLNLTNDQRERLAGIGKEWNKQMALQHQGYQTDPQGTTKLYNDLNQKTNQQYNSVLTPSQQQMYRQMTGAPYAFPPSVYFQGNGIGNGGSGK